MIDRVILDVQVAHAKPRGKAVGSNQRREARVQAGARLTFNRQQLAIAPEIFGALLDASARDRPGDRRVVVRHFEWTQTAVAHPESGGGEGGLAQMAAEAEVHRFYTSGYTRQVLHVGFYTSGSTRRVLHVGFYTTGSTRVLHNGLHVGFRLMRGQSSNRTRQAKPFVNIG